MSKILAALVLAFAACTPHTRTPHTPAADLLERESVALVAAVPVIEANGEDITVHTEFRAYCSGVWVAEDAFVTANHCVDDKEQVSYAVRADVLERAEDEVEAIRRGTVVRRDEAHDLALVRARLAPEHTSAHVSEAVVGQNVASMGSPLGRWFSYSAGNVAAIRVQDGTWLVQATAPISPGNSGGGLFDEDGDLLGIADFYMPRGENMNFFVDGRYVSGLLNEP